MISDGRQGGDNNRVVSPDGYLRPIISCQFFHMLDGAFVVDDAKLQFARIPVDGVLDDNRVSSFTYFWEMLEEWADVLGPEDKAFYCLRPEVNGVDLSPVGVDHFARTSPQAVHEPLSVEGGNVGFVAG